MVTYRLALQDFNCFDEGSGKRIHHSNKMAAFSDDDSFNFGFLCVPWLTIWETALFHRVIQSNANSAATQSHQHSGWKPRLKWRHAVLLNMWAVHIETLVSFLGIKQFVPITPPLDKTRMALVYLIVWLRVKCQGYLFCFIFPVAVLEISGDELANEVSDNKMHIPRHDVNWIAW
jgi:hypothetical protein